VIARIVLWSLYDTKTTIEELREKLPTLEPPSAWLWNEASERFGLVSFGEPPVPALSEARALIGAEPDAFEEFELF
jgi:hypothetical protein